jgi:hypothetical protein
MMTTMELPAPLGQEIDEQLLRLRGLVLVRDLLIQRGASPEDVAAHADEADRVRAELAELLAGQA